MRLRIDIVTVIFMACAFFVSFPSPIRCEMSANDPAALASSSDDKAWTSLIRRRIAEEKAGRKPPTQAEITWKQYWTSWYDVIRISPGLPWKPSQFKTKEDMIQFIKNSRRAHGLPKYE
jgi:hypothetical protein